MKSSEGFCGVAAVAVLLYIICLEDVGHDAVHVAAVFCHAVEDFLMAQLLFVMPAAKFVTMEMLA